MQNEIREQRQREQDDRGSLQSKTTRISRSFLRKRSSPFKTRERTLALRRCQEQFQNLGNPQCRNQQQITHILR